MGRGTFIACCAALGCCSGASALEIVLPTPNQALFEGGGPAFYMHVNRDFEGESSHPWQGGQYGFVRNPLRTSAGTVYTRFHEGLDIRPLKRDAAGEPLDPVWAIADGKVVYVNATSSRSNYGRYVVIEHIWDGCPYYSLYGHLKSTAVAAGRQVKQKEIIGQLGYSGVGIDRSRAHVHFEINLLANRKFDGWHDAAMKEPNWHGVYNGLNLFGIDAARLFIENRKNPGLTLPQFLGGEPVFFKVRIPNTGRLDILDRYPWLAGAPVPEPPPSWEISFTKSGLPVRVVPSAARVSAPVLSELKPTDASPYYHTIGRVTRSGSKASLTQSGLRFLRVFTWPD